MRLFLSQVGNNLTSENYRGLEVDMKKFAYVLVLMLLSCTMIFAGCGAKGFKNNPNASDLVLGNGGLVVQQGEYLYFANGYDTYSNASKDMVKGGLYRTKLDGQYFASLDEHDYLTNAEKVSGRLVGYEFGGIYLFDGYVYYATPNMEKDKEGNTLRDYVDFYRVKVNGTDEKRIYTSDGSMTNGKWGMVKVDSTLYLVVYNGDSVVSVVANGKKHTATTMATDVTDVVFADNYEYNARDWQTTDTDRYIWYTRNTKEEETITGSNIFARCKLGTTEEETLLNTDTYHVVDLKNDRVYVNVTDHNLGTTKLSSFAVSNVSDVRTFSLQNATNAYVMDTKGNELVVFENNSVFELYSMNGLTARYEATLDDLTSATIVNVKAGHIYYVKDSVLKVIDILTKESEVVCGDSDVSMPTDTALYDFDGRNIYFMHSYVGENETSNQYLTRFDTQKSSPVYEMIGKFESGHTPKVEEAEEE